MKVRINKSIFTGGLSKVIGVVPNNPSVFILGNVKLETGWKRLEITATSLDLTIGLQVDAEVLDGGAITVPARKFLEIIKSLSKDDIEIDVSENNNQVFITDTQSRFKLSSIPAEDYPANPVVEGKSMKVTKERFRSMFKHVSSSMSKDEFKPTLMGVCLSSSGDEMKMVATDGKRLSRSIHHQEEEFEEVSVILPSKTVHLLEKLTEGEGEVIVTISDDKQAKFQITHEKKELDHEIAIISKLTEGKFPDASRVIPKNKGVALKVDREAFINAVRLSSLILDESNYMIEVVITDNKLIVKGSSQRYGESEEVVHVDYSECEVIRTAFNPDFLLDSLRCVPDQEITFNVKDNSMPAIIEGSDNYCCVVMPLRLS